MKEYIYNRYNGVITTYKKLNNNVYMCLETGLTIDLDLELMLGKTSENIIELIEVEDIIGYKIKNISTTLETKGFIEGIIDISDEEHLENIKKDKNYEIKSIVTKEQFKSVEYKVGG